MTPHVPCFKGGYFEIVIIERYPGVRAAWKKRWYCGCCDGVAVLCYWPAIPEKLRILSVRVKFAEGSPASPEGNWPWPSWGG